MLEHYEPHEHDSPAIARAKLHLKRAAESYAHEQAAGLDRMAAGAQLRQMNAAHVNPPREQS